MKSSLNKTVNIISGLVQKHVIINNKIKQNTLKQQNYLELNNKLDNLQKLIGSTSNSIEFFKCVSFDFGTCVESQTEIQLIGSFSGQDPYMGTVAYPQLAGVYSIVDASKTGTQRMWQMTKSGKTYYIYWFYVDNIGSNAWLVGTDTGSVGMLFGSNTTDPIGAWSDPYMGVNVDGFSRKAIVNTPPAKKTWSGYKQVVYQGITFYDTSTLYTDLTYGDTYPIPGKVYNDNCTVQQTYIPSTAPMSFYARQAGTVVVQTYWGKPLRDTLKYRIGTSGDWVAPVKDQAIHVAQGQIIQFWNESAVCNLCYPDTYGEYDYQYNFILKFTSGAFQGGGNVMSMVNLADTGCFQRLFEANSIGDVSHLTSAPEFPMRNLPKGCYSMLFAGDDHLVIPPEFPPIASAAQQAFGSTFSDCDALTYLPQIICTSVSLKTLCSSMFTMCDPAKLKFMNFIATDWGHTNVFNWSGGNTEFGVFFKASILPASIIQPTSTYTYRIPAKWLIVDQF